jgi:hypothetical protein
MGLELYRTPGPQSAALSSPGCRDTCRRSLGSFRIPNPQGVIASQLGVLSRHSTRIFQLQPVEHLLAHLAAQIPGERHFGVHAEMPLLQHWWRYLNL